MGPVWKVFARFGLLPPVGIISAGFLIAHRGWPGPAFRWEADPEFLVVVVARKGYRLLSPALCPAEVLSSVRTGSAADQMKGVMV